MAWEWNGASNERPPANFTSLLMKNNLIPINGIHVLLPLLYEQGRQGGFPASTVARKLINFNVLFPTDFSLLDSPSFMLSLSHSLSLFHFPLYRVLLGS